MNNKTVRFAAIALAVALVAGQSAVFDNRCSAADAQESECATLVTVPSWGHWLTGKDASVSTHFLDFLELLTRSNSHQRGGNR